MVAKRRVEQTNDAPMPNTGEPAVTSAPAPETAAPPTEAPVVKKPEPALDLMPDLGPIQVPPLSGLTLMIFGEPKAGKTTFVSGNPGVFIYGTEPGQEFVKARKLYVNKEIVSKMGVKDEWQVFSKLRATNLP